ncbi:50S ribosomal protein L6 [Patescibacteria group bacterium]|nr:50S ribosomal protein L6 [Patescibacteria group bacterium]
MSKIGKKLITIPEDIIVKIEGDILKVSSRDGKKNLELDLLLGVEAKINETELVFNIKNKDIQSRANWGTMRALAQNAILGVKDDFKKILEFKGVGFKANIEGGSLILNIGFSHPVNFKIPEGITITTDKSTITIVGISKYLVGQVASTIRAFKKPNPYRGTGIKYKGEVIRKKAGKTATSGTGVGS